MTATDRKIHAIDAGLRRRMGVPYMGYCLRPGKVWFRFQDNVDVKLAVFEIMYAGSMVTSDDWVISIMSYHEMEVAR